MGGNSVAMQQGCIYMVLCFVGFGIRIDTGSRRFSFRNFVGRCFGGLRFGCFCFFGSGYRSFGSVSRCISGRLCRFRRSFLLGCISKILLGFILGGMMSVDMGGPFNKAAYVFGTASIASGQFDIMASVMIGGMVPPIAIALATTFFKNRFTKSEQQTSITNYIMGLSFITEGAIPFAASDPLRIIPPCVVGSAIAGALSMMFGCGSRAPHGGIFVIGIIDNPLMFLIALVVGAVVAMAGIVLLKKPLKAE